MQRKYAVDLIAMSYSILDDMVLNEIKHYFENSLYRYECIIYQMGAHHGYYIDCVKSEGDAIKFADRTLEILLCLKQYSMNVIAVSSTLERCFDKAGKKISNHNKEIEKRNQILEVTALKAQVKFWDLNKKLCDHVLRYLDWCHFNEGCYELIAQLFITDFFADIKYISSNQIETVRELEEKIRLYNGKKIYIYGNGIRGRRIQVYLCGRGCWFGGFVVSDEYKGFVDQEFGLDEIEKKDTLVIVTPIDIDVWEKLEQKRLDYITLHSDVNTFLRLYTDME